MNLANYSNPWAGLASYEDPEKAEHKLKFCGRGDETYDVAKLITNNVFLTLYGKSGIGKTSLLNAGVFPELREENYTPISLRLGFNNKSGEISYQAIIVEAIERTVEKSATIDVINEQTDQQAVDYLWNYFARHRFYCKDGELTTPVIVLDQFEEVLHNDRAKAETLLRQIDYLNDKDHTLDNCTIDGQNYRYEQNFRFVVSIREDDLYRLEDSIDNCYLPALKRCRYRLRSLSAQGAREAILGPGDGLFPNDEQERDRIVDRIIDYVSNKNSKSISTNILSLICSQLYQAIQTQNIQVVDDSCLDLFFNDSPIEKFYLEAIKGLSSKEIKYIETNLVDSAGRRNSVSINDFNKYIKHQKNIINNPQALFHVVNVSSGEEGARVELIHDKLAEIISKKKENNEKKLRKYLYFSIAYFFIAILLVVLSFLFKNEEQYFVEFREDESLSLTDYWIAHVSITDGADTIVNDTINKTSTKLSFSYAKKGPLECDVKFVIGDMKDFESELSLSDTTYLIVPISRAANKIKYEGIVKRGGDPIVDAIVIIGDQTQRTDRLGRFVIYSDPNSFENDGKIKIIKEGFKIYDKEIKEKVDGKNTIYQLDIINENYFKNKYNRIETKLNSLGRHHYDGIVGKKSKATMYLCKEGDSLFGYYYYPNQHYEDAPKNKKYTRYILFEGTIDSDMQTFSVKSVDAVLNKCDYYGTIANGVIMNDSIKVEGVRIDNDEIEVIDKQNKPEVVECMVWNEFSKDSFKIDRPIVVNALLKFVGIVIGLALWPILIPLVLWFVHKFNNEIAIDMIETTM